MDGEYSPLISAIQPVSRRQVPGNNRDIGCQNETRQQ